MKKISSKIMPGLNKNEVVGKPFTFLGEHAGSIISYDEISGNITVEIYYYTKAGKKIYDLLQKGELNNILNINLNNKNIYKIKEY